MNRKWKLGITGLLTAVMLVMGGCSKQSGNQIVSVQGKSYDENEMYYNIYYNMGMNYGSVLEFDETDNVDTIKQKLNDLSANEQYKKLVNMQKIIFLKQKIADAQALKVAKESGITLTDEDKSTIQEQMNKQKDFFSSEDSVAQVKASLYPDDEDGDKKAKEYLQKYQAFLFGMYSARNFNDIEKVVEEQTLISKLLEQKSQEIPDDEEYVKNYYNELSKSQKESYDASKAMLEYDIQLGTPIVYYPAGMRRVKHILVGFTEEEVAKLDEYQATIDELNGKENRSDEENAKLDQAKKDYDSKKAEMEKRVKARADEAYAKLQAGTPYDEVLKEYGEDASMKEESSSYQAGGYLMSESSNYVKEFLEVAMALAKVGDYSQPVLSDYGYHIIQYAAEVKNETVPYESIRDELLTVAMDEKRKEEMVVYYSSLYDQVMAENGAQIRYDALGISEDEYKSLYQELMATQTNEEEQGE